MLYTQNTVYTHSKLLSITRRTFCSYEFADWHVTGTCTLAIWLQASSKAVVVLGDSTAQNVREGMQGPCVDGCASFKRPSWQWRSTFAWKFKKFQTRRTRYQYKSYNVHINPYVDDLVIEIQFSHGFWSSSQICIYSMKAYKHTLIILFCSILFRYSIVW